jgi:hypothetical protein
MRKINISPPEASLYLFENWGIRRSESTLAKLRCLGGSPQFFKAGRNILYARDSLDIWATELLGTQISSTSQMVKRNSGEGRNHASL